MIIKIQKNFFINLNNCKFFHIHKDSSQRTCITIDDRHMNDKSTFVIGDIKCPSNKYCKEVSDTLSEHLESNLLFLDAFEICKHKMVGGEETSENIELKRESEDEI